MAAAGRKTTAFEILEQEPDFLVSREAQNREPRYLFFAGDEPGLAEPGGMAVGTKCVRGGVLWRCAVTPVTSAPVRMRAVDIPEGRILDGTQDDRGLASALLACGPEVDELLAQYGSGDPAQWQKRWGLVELTEWRGMAPSEVAKLNLTTAFFPSWPDVPATNKEVLEHLESKRAEIEAAPVTEKFSAAQKAKFLKTADQMIEGVRQAQTYQANLIRQGNMRVTYPDTNDAFKPGFDSKDELFSQRSGVGLAINSLRGNQSDAAAAGMEAVLDKVLAKFAPAAAQTAPAPIDANAIAAIVAATVQALKADEGSKVTDAKAQKRQ